MGKSVTALGVAAGVLVVIPLFVAILVIAGSGAVIAQLGQSCIPSAAPTASGHVRLMHANEYVGLSDAAFARDMTALTSSGPDFITLNEVHARTDRQLRPSGYDLWRSAGAAPVRETPVLWRTDRWRAVDRGSLLLHRSGVQGGTRHANWVTLTPTIEDGLPEVSVISVHEIQAQTTPRRRALARLGLTRLNDLITHLSAVSVVLVGGDFNAHYRPTGGQPAHSPTVILRVERRSQ